MTAFVLQGHIRRAQGEDGTALSFILVIIDIIIIIEFIEQ